MVTRLEHRLDSLRARRTDATTGAVILKEARLAKAMLSPGARDALDYFTESAEPVPADYTAKTFDECARVQNQLAHAYDTAGLPVSFDHQGSVTNNTHIRFHSDIDLLTVTGKFCGLRSPLKPTIPYPGDPVADLLAIRTTTVGALRGAFPAAKVDDGKSRCVAISGGSLSRKVDVVACNWLHTEAYAQLPQKRLLGIEVLDTNGPRRVPNFPFLHNARIEERDIATAGALRRCIRIAKSVKYDSEQQIGFSSYDIASVCYNMPLGSLVGQSDVSLAINFARFAFELLNDSAKRDGVMVPNDTRPVFGGQEGASPSELRKLVDEVLELLTTALPKAA